MHLRSSTAVLHLHIEMAKIGLVYPERLEISSNLNIITMTCGVK